MFSCFNEIQDTAKTINKILEHFLGTVYFFDDYVEYRLPNRNPLSQMKICFSSHGDDGMGNAVPGGKNFVTMSLKTTELIALSQINNGFQPRLDNDSKKTVLARFEMSDTSKVMDDVIMAMLRMSVPYSGHAFYDTVVGIIKSFDTNSSEYRICVQDGGLKTIADFTFKVSNPKFDLKGTMANIEQECAILAIMENPENHGLMFPNCLKQRLVFS